MRHYLRTAIIWAIAICGPSSTWAQEATADKATTRQITRLQDELYLVRDGQRYTVFVVTSEGIILGDPLGREAALWLRDQIRARFQKEVHFVLHTYHHYTRAAGSSVFNDTAEIVAQALFQHELGKSRRDQPELYRFDVRPKLHQGKHLVTLGGETVAVIPVRASGTPEMAVLQFRRERVVFAAGSPAFGSVPFSFGTFTAHDVYAWLDALVALEFDSLVLADGRIVSRTDFDRLATYLSALRAAVARAAPEGRTLSEIESAAAVDRLRANPHYAQRDSQVAAIYAGTRWTGLQISAGAASNYGVPSSAFCASRTTCSAGGAVPAVRFTASVSGTRRIGLAAEATFIGQAWSARTSPEVDDEEATDRSRVALLFRYAPSPRASKFSYALVGGPALTFDRVRGLDNVKMTFGTASHAIDERKWWLSVTVGGDLERRFGGRMAVRLPVRLTLFRGEAFSYLHSTLDLQVGVDVTFKLFRWVSLP